MFGVPAITSRNGFSAPTSCPAFNNVRPTWRSRVCASSTRRSTGRSRERAARISAMGGAGSSAGFHERPATVNWPAASCFHHGFGSRSSRSRASSGASAGRRVEGSTPASGAASRRSQLRRAVLPLPRGPNITTCVPGAMPRASSVSSSRKNVCSSFRPARYGGVAPVPGRKGPRADLEDIPAVIAGAGWRAAGIRFPAPAGCGRRSATTWRADLATAGVADRMRRSRS